MKQFNNEESPSYVRTAGKITILTAFVGLVVFMLALMVDVGSKEFTRVSAQVASTSLTVLNTPPSFTVNAYEVIESSTSSPTNSGDVVQWSALGSDSNLAPYFLLICSTNATPTANAAADPGSLGTAPPECGAGAIQWAVSTSTVTDTVATVATTTSEAAPFSEVNNWYAWVCDDDPYNPRCNNTPVQGYSATNSSPFNINSRPTFTAFSNDGPVDPSGTLGFNSTSSDPDVAGGQDALYLVVCNSNSDYDVDLNTCPNDFIASTTITILSDTAATYTLPAIIRDDTYPAYGYILDEHGHEALANPRQADFEVNNVAPVLLSSEVEIGGRNGLGTDLLVDDANAAETPSSTISFTISDANSCVTAASTTDEIRGFNVSVFRTSIGTTTCDTTAGSYNPNNCYPSQVGTSVWNLQCTATTTCTNPLQDEMSYTCTYPLWYVADPTDNAANIPAALEADTWSAAVEAYDDDSATSSLVASAIPVELVSFSAIDIISASIAYGSIEPGDNNTNLSATSTALNIGNTGLDQEVRGESMCDLNFFGVTIGNCPNYSTSSIPDWRQQFSTTSYSYDVDATEGGGSLDPRILQLSSSTDQELELNVPKTTATSTPQEAKTYWGIAVPVTIQLAGSYSGLNTFTARTAEAVDWGI